MLAAKNGHEMCVRLLLLAGSTPCEGHDMTQKHDGSTALMLAAKNGHDKCIKMMLKRDWSFQSELKVWRRTVRGKKAAELRLERSRYNGILIENNNGMTALKFAEQEGHEECRWMLLEYKKEHHLDEFRLREEFDDDAIDLSLL
jgi:ankyrin repeat protein